MSCQGNDNSNGISAQTPWATLARASRRYHPGDQVLLQRSCVWRGTLEPSGSGTTARPIVVSAYGSGPLPRLIGDDASALVLKNVSSWTVDNLDLTQVNQKPAALDARNKNGEDLDPNSERSMRPVVDVRALGAAGDRACGASCRDSDITLENLVVHDGQWNGIYVGAGYANSDANVSGNVDHLTIRSVESRGNAAAGIAIEGTFDKEVRYELRTVQVLDSYLHDNGGDGVVMSQVDDGLIQGNHCSYNGRVRNARVGCWAWDSKHVTIQYNEADHNMTPINNSTASDGGGLDLDMGTIDSTMQYNWTHDNEGEGYLVTGQPLSNGYRCCATSNVTVRYNVSERDGMKENGGITLYGGVTGAWVYNNTVYYVASRPANTAMSSGTGGDLTTYAYAGDGSPTIGVANNIFIADGTRYPSADDTNFWSDGRGSFHFDHNLWVRVEGGVHFHFGGSEPSSLLAWQALGYDNGSADTDPRVAGPLGSGPTGYQLQLGSPAIDAGSRVLTPAGMGSRDYFGAAIPQSGGYDIGAVEHSGTSWTQNSNASPLAHMTTSASLHVAAIDVMDGSNTAAVTSGSSVGWEVRVVDTNGSPAAGATVEMVVYKPSWDAIYATVSATTDAAGMARFSRRTDKRDATGAYYLAVLQLVPGSAATYYDSAQNTAWTSSFTLR